MREPWLYCPTLQPGRNVLAPSDTQHAVQSLRLHANDTVTLFDGLGRIGRAVLLAETASSPRAARGRQRKPPAFLVDTVQLAPPPPRTLTLIVPGCKGARLDWLVEKGTELGVSRFILTEFEHSVVHVGLQHVRKLARTAVEACKQSHRARLPQIEAVRTLAEAIAAVAGATLLVAHIDAHAPWLVEQPPTSQRAVVIGPEGGLAPAELAAVQAAGGQIVRLADHILRVETAALAAAAQWPAT
jgi:16S rRNA (uracil1498-N3)-methyltransferase